ncbi:DinB family protein [Bacillus sp. RG28]|uniref:DinB family protein n=1 Tax=Gottfriedia endophytica TaxID=2820819 RepID=A0A940NK46_9BACI|nr:DinB family protein [Gottfriedia endophytica]MBP0723659.1 DinB family protein [Gottfriedia endophytica]
MYDYNVWANKEMINRLKELPKDIYHSDIQSGYSSISQLLTHIYLVEQAWFDIISGQTMNEAMALASKLQKQIESKEIVEMETLYDDLSLKNKSLLFNQVNMDQVIVVNNPYVGLLETSISESVLHVVTHGNYHRGNIATMLRQLGYSSVMQDYGLYLYKRENAKAE